MAEQNNIPPRPSTFNTLEGGFTTDYVDGMGPANIYTRCRNGTTVLPAGRRGGGGGNGGRHTEPANSFETSVPYTLIGSVQLHGDIWWLFSTNNVNSEIGEYNENTGAYVTKLNDVATIAAGLPGLGFNTSHLITGAARRNFDCGFDIYWSDGALNPDRMIDTQYLYPNPWVQDCTTIASCITCVNTNKIDIEQIRLAPQFSVPCLKLSKSTASGTLLNGSYQVCMRYAINTIPCTDFVALSNIQSIFAHGNSAGAVVVKISGISTETTVIFPEMELVVVSMVNFQVQAKRLGIYSTTQQTVYIDNLDNELINIDIKLLPISNPVIDKSDAIYSISNYLTRVGTYEKPEFNYQPLANLIQAFWNCIEYPEDYYHKGGNNGFPMNVGHQRGERYAYYIRWRYTTGECSASFHIPGLPGGTPATLLSITPITQEDGGVLIASGRFAGYSSTELYPNNQPLVWTTLCGLPVRHHEFPDQSTFGGTILSHYFNYGSTTSPNTRIRVMGVSFGNIQPPVDNNGNVIPNIQGYEILRAVRNGHEHILACGQINNMRTYTDSGGQQGLFQNYPYNDLSADNYLTNNINNINKGTVGNGLRDPLFGFSGNIVSFHSPDTVFNQPYLGTGTLKVVQGMYGNSHGQFQVPYKHPLFKVLTNFDSWLGNLIALIEILIQAVNAATVLAGGNPNELTLAATESIPFSFPLYVANDYTTDIAGTDLSTPVKIASAAANLAIIATFSFIEAAIVREQILTTIKGLIPGRQYAAQYNSSGFYTNPFPLQASSTYTINDYEYIRGQMQYFAGFTINNLYRNNYVALNLNTIPNPYMLPTDNSRYTLGNSPNFNWDNSHTISAYYAAYTVPQAAQYGQIDSTKQVPISCMIPVIPTTGAVYTSPIIFGGDIYICRYTEKNPMFFFNDWLLGAPEDTIYDYRNYINVPYPMFWINNDVINYTLLGLASTNRRLDGPLNLTPFYVDNGYFYLFCNGVRDFYVESTVNVGYRDWEDPIPKLFYDPYGFQDVNQMFRSDIIKSDIFYKYDYSLSSKDFFNQYLSWGQCYQRDYDPILAYTCNNYFPRRIAYSLPQEEELKKDNWKVFLPNNYKDMPTKVSCIKDINKTGALILLHDQAPQSFVGTESIASKSGTEFTTGTGTLFNQSLQSITNVDDSYQYGSCQNRLAIVSTPYGVFWVSQNTGKIFRYSPGEQLTDIAEHGLKYDLSLYLPSQLLMQYPDYPLYDNPVAGIGVQLIYDSVNIILYICKKDYKVIVPNETSPGFVQYIPGDGWVYNDDSRKISYIINLGDPTYFQDCSWTLSYSIEDKRFISTHDWTPSLHIPGRNHFLTASTSNGNLGNSLYRHNTRTDLFCNFYGIDYPFEIEYPITTGTNITTLENLEYFMESYNWKANHIDAFHKYNEGFNECLIYNSEQATPLMIMNLKPANDPWNTAGYPFFTALGVNTFYTKQEQKYRISMSLRDYTFNRSQYGIGVVQLVQTQPNWKDWLLNNLYYDFSKSWDNLKKIRHFKSRVLLRKTIVGFNSMTFYFGKSNNTNSPR